tara:strand:- start:746 stop:964 length:219 start_codon:yes stop_codon:yes gene_type:complete
MKRQTVKERKLELARQQLHDSNTAWNFTHRIKTASKLDLYRNKLANSDNPVLVKVSELDDDTLTKIMDIVYS